MPFAELDINLNYQYRSYYCYAAVSQAIVQYYTGQYVPQPKIEQALGPRYQDPVNYLLPLGLIRPKSASQFGYKGIPPWKTVVAEIQAGRPIIVFVGVHYVLLVGFEGDSARDPKRLYIFSDPLDPIHEGILYQTLKDTGYMVGDTYEMVRG